MKYWKIGLGLALMLVLFCCGSAVAQPTGATVEVAFDGTVPNGVVEVYAGDPTTPVHRFTTNGEGPISI